MSRALENVLVNCFNATPLRKVVKRVFATHVHSRDARLAPDNCRHDFVDEDLVLSFLLSRERSNFSFVEQRGQDHRLHQDLAL